MSTPTFPTFHPSAFQRHRQGSSFGTSSSLVLRQLHLVPLIVLPVHRSGNNVANSGAILQVVAFLASLIITGLWIATVFLGFPMPWIAFAVSYVIVNTVVILQGKVIIHSNISEEGFEEEAWFL